MLGDHFGTNGKTRLSSNEARSKADQERNVLISGGLWSSNRLTNIRSDSRDSRSGFLFQDQKALLRNPGSIRVIRILVFFPD
jgi:hypothetical protein